MKKILAKAKAFIFDLDGTVIDSMPVWDKVYAAPFEKYDIDVPEGYVMRVNHMGLDECVRYTLAATPLPCGEEELKAIWQKASFDEYALNISLKEGARELMTALKENGIKIALATASPYELFVPCLKRLNVYSLFDLFVSTDDVSRGKDDPEIYLEAARKLGFAPEECVVVEDSHIGIASAKTAGFFTVGVFDKASEKYAGFVKENSDIYVNSLSELTQLL